MLKIHGILTISLFVAWSGISLALPVAQLDINGSDVSYDPYTVTVVTSDPLFTLFGYGGTPFSDGKTLDTNLSWYLSFAIVPQSNAGTDFGTFSIDGVAYDMSDLSFGYAPSDSFLQQETLPVHWVFPTSYGLLPVIWNPNVTRSAVNVQSTPGTDPAANPGNALMYVDWVVDATGLLPGFGLHFDLFGVSCPPNQPSEDFTNCTIVQYAPFTHDATYADLAADADDDGVFDAGDLCPGTTESALVDQAGCSDVQVDSDGDGVCDPGAPSVGPSSCAGSDEFPDDPSESSDNDNDGTGDNADPDDDNDGQADVDELTCGSDPLNAGSRSVDSDADGIPDCVDSDDDDDLVSDGADMCPGTAIPEAAPTSSFGLNRNRWALMRADGVFTQAPPQGGTLFVITTTHTRGCSCEQIVEATNAGNDHLSRGCSTSLLLDWINNP